MSTQTQITIMDCMDRKLRYFYIQHDGYINGSTHTIIEKLNRESKNLNFKNTDELVNGLNKEYTNFYGHEYKMIEYNFINNCGDIESWALINFKDRYNDYRTTGDFYYWGLVLNEPLPIIEKYLKEIFKFDELPISKTGKNCLSGAL